MNPPLVVEPPTTTTRPQPRTLDAAALVFRRRVKVIDRIARGLISFSGAAIICAVLGIGVFLVWEMWPLFRGARVAPARIESVLAPAEPAALTLIDEHQEKTLIIGTAPVARVHSLLDQEASSVELPLPGLEGQRISAASAWLRESTVAIGTDGGDVWIGSIDLRTVFDGSRRRIEPFVEPATLLTDIAPAPITQIAYRLVDDRALLAVIDATGQARVSRIAVTRPLIGPARYESSTVALPMPEFGRPTAALVSDNAEQVLIATDAGQLVRWRVPMEGSAQALESAQVVRQGAVSAMAYLLGARSVAVGGSDGSVATWSLVRQAGHADGWRLTRLHTFPAHQAPVSVVAASPRDKGFITISSAGTARLHYMTSERTLAEWSLQADPQTAYVAPKANGAVFVDRQGRLHHWRIHNPHPEFSWSTLFGKVWYEGYPEPDYVWQSTGGTDDFESKFSLVPLTYGTLKGTFYAMLFAVPLALFGALYCSQFLDKRLRAPIKSTVELMAALPSVVLGFVAGLVMAPLVQQHVVATLAIPVVIPTVAIAGMFAMRAHPALRAAALRHEFWLLTAWIVVGLTLAAWAGPWLERLVFGGDFDAWLLRTTATHYDQRNALVVGWAMGFAVIPIIFTICEDAFSAVPKHLVGASLACGASPWQTAWRVVLPAAGSGVFSAIMVGFGRAVGETMIVLMATGNTPVMDWSMFNGFRALSANIAVEIPEAPYGGTLYRMLFVAALLLFALTSIVNTAAELIRLRLRRRLQGL